MSIADALLPEFDREMGVTRRLLERVPAGRFEWQPHPKSMTLGRLAEHLAELPQWLGATVHGTASTWRAHGRTATSRPPPAQRCCPCSMPTPPPHAPRSPAARTPS
ncbi:MAG: hypothetical protein R2712_01920 [Vicinamibacterales bacterium]